MKKNIHPAYHDATATCSCGATLATGSTEKSLNVEICSQCHPFYTGKKKMLDSTGRVDRFKKLAAKVAAKQEAVTKAKAEKKDKAEAAKVAAEKKSPKKKVTKKK
ncbi:50S ribosomal protein L31 [Patescibacteria group bacterium]|nr:MAG: 50S ribosomal protein L31 [Patescibacteria group bacterium]